MFSFLDFRYSWILDLLAIKALRRHGGGLSEFLADCIPLSYSQGAPDIMRIVVSVWGVDCVCGSQDLPFSTLLNWRYARCYLLLWGVTFAERFLKFLKFLENIFSEI